MRCGAPAVAPVNIEQAHWPAGAPAVRPTAPHRWQWLHESGRKKPVGACQRQTIAWIRGDAPIRMFGVSLSASRAIRRAVGSWGAGWPHQPTRLLAPAWLASRPRHASRNPWGTRVIATSRHVQAIQVLRLRPLVRNLQCAGLAVAVEQPSSTNPRLNRSWRPARTKLLRRNNTLNKFNADMACPVCF